MIRSSEHVTAEIPVFAICAACPDWRGFGKDLILEFRISDCGFATSVALKGGVADHEERREQHHQPVKLAIAAGDEAEENV